MVNIIAVNGKSRHIVTHTTSSVPKDQSWWRGEGGYCQPVRKGYTRRQWHLPSTRTIDFVTHALKRLTSQSSTHVFILTDSVNLLQMEDSAKGSSDLHTLIFNLRCKYSISCASTTLAVQPVVWNRQKDQQAVWISQLACSWVK